MTFGDNGEVAQAGEFVDEDRRCALGQLFRGDGLEAKVRVLYALQEDGLMKLCAVSDAPGAEEIVGGDAAAYFLDAKASSAPLPVEAIDGVSPGQELTRDGGLAFEVVGVDLKVSGGAKNAALCVDEAEVVA